ncbi:hypothetical protein L3Y34_000255 [Caenorhabditis briggsae]|uniref:Uncharacterized protein n=1 Tax=Caenorhabditis briggsae TaxID=6238 RepID=A0AAE9D8W7_CAEBR|nr:hypothetical protein L3Y34_000255 [Caenorhabditis briggsae]
MLNVHQQVLERRKRRPRARICWTCWMRPLLGQQLPRKELRPSEANQLTPKRPLPRSQMTLQSHALVVDPAQLLPTARPPSPRAVQKLGHQPNRILGQEPKMEGPLVRLQSRLHAQPLLHDQLRNQQNVLEVPLQKEPDLLRRNQWSRSRHPKLRPLFQKFPDILKQLSFILFFATIFILIFEAFNFYQHLLKLADIANP